MTKDHINELWQQAKLDSISLNQEVQHVFYWKIVNEERAAYMDMMRPQIEEDLKNALARF